MPKKSLPNPTSEQDVINAIVKRLDQSRTVTHMHTYEHFNRSLGIWESILRQDPMGPWLEACRDLEFGLEPLVEALAILWDQALHNYHDIIGGVYMTLGQGEKRLGQYFTPWNVARMMAQLTLHDFVPPEPGQPPITFCEPCVGSGILILAAAETIEERFPGTIARGGVEFYGMDKDPVCVAMARLNMKIHGIGRHVQRIEDLTPQQRRMLERLIGRRLPGTGALVDGPEIREGDTLLDSAYLLPEADLPQARDGSKQEPSLPSQGKDIYLDILEVDVTLEAESDQAPGNELIIIPELVAQDLWATTEVNGTMETSQEQMRQGVPSSRRHKGGSGTKQPEYTSVQLFPLSSDESSN